LTNVKPQRQLTLLPLTRVPENPDLKHIGLGEVKPVNDAGQYTIRDFGVEYGRTTGA
jgi:hypothetical protein